MKVRGEHEISCCGSRVRISPQGIARAQGIRVLTQPTIEYCPLHEALYGTKKIDKETVRKSVEKKIYGTGLCCSDRLFDAEPVVAYGASEMMKVWLEKNMIDCSVVVCEGAGTVITTRGSLVQAIGARLTGIMKTSPIPEVIDHIEREGGTVLNRLSAQIDQVEGVRRALDLGHRHVAVSVAGFQAEAISRTRDLEDKARADVFVFSVCNTSVRMKDVKHVAKADVACASASKILRTEIGSKALMQLGVTIPVYALTSKGKSLILAYLDEFSDRLVAFRTNRLPYSVEGKGPRLKK